MGRSEPLTNSAERRVIEAVVNAVTLAMCMNEVPVYNLACPL